MGRNSGRQGAEEGRPPVGRRRRPAWAAGLRELKGPLCSVPRLPAGQQRISSAAPDPGGSAAPLGTDTNSSRPSCPASYLGNQTQSPDVTGRCIATGEDSPSRGPRPGAEVSVARDTARRGGRCPHRPSPVGPRPRSRPGAVLPPPTPPSPVPNPGGRGPAPAEEAAPPGLGPARPKCDPPAAGVAVPERSLCLPSPRLAASVFRSSLVSHQAPTWAPAPATGSRWPGGGVFVPLPSVAQEISASLGHLPRGRRHRARSRHSAPIPGSLLHSGAFPWRLCGAIDLLP